MSEETNGCQGSEPVVEDRSENCVPGVEEDGGSSERQCDTLEGLTQSKALAAFLGQLKIVEIPPGGRLYQEGDLISQVCYIVSGRVEVKATGELIATVEKGELLGLEEFRYRKESPKYTQEAVAVLPTSVVWLDNEGLRTVLDLNADCLAAYVRLQARVKRAIEKKLGQLKIDKSKLEVRVARLGVALGATQEQLVKLQKPPQPPPPPRKPLPSTALLGKLDEARRVIREMGQLFVARATNLKKLLVALHEFATKHPDWAKQEDFVAFKKSFEGLVERDSQFKVP